MNLQKEKVRPTWNRPAPLKNPNGGTERIMLAIVPPNNCIVNGGR